MLTNLNSLEEILQIKFRNQQILKEALTHRSFLNETKESIPSNERLEFLGDAVLELLVSGYLFEKFPHFPEGRLTNLRSAIVNTKTLAQVAKRLRLGDFMYLSKGEEVGGGRSNISLLADVFESVLGAIYIDQGIVAARKVLTKFIFPQVSKFVKKGCYFDYKSVLQEKVQEKYRVTPTYSVLKEEGPDHAKKFYSAVFVGEKKLGEGKGKSKQEAEQEAAKAALEEWEAK